VKAAGIELAHDFDQRRDGHDELEALLPACGWQSRSPRSIAGQSPVSTDRRREKPRMS
jgi:hypothetical protein